MANVNLHSTIGHYAQTIQQSLKSVAPKRTGVLANSIKADVNISNQIDIGVEMVKYGNFVNDGTRYIKATHFIENTITTSLLNTMAEDVAEALWEDFVEEINNNNNI